MGFLLEQFDSALAGAPLFIGPKTLTRAELIMLAKQKAKSFKGEFMAVSSANGGECVADFLAADMLSVPIVLGGQCEKCPSGEVNFFTSGTQGKPKLVSRSWREVFSSVKRSESLRENVWFTAFSPLLFAGLQVFAQVLVSGGSMALSSGDPAQDADFLRKIKDFNLNATPSWARNFLIFADTRGVFPKRIILGGEAADQRLLDALKERFPLSKITHIYATSELGARFEVRDGKEGIPLGMLVKDCKIEDSRLFIMREGQWVDTSDLVEVSGGRMLFKGRLNDVANVGGRKVRLQDVENLYWGIQGIKDLMAYPVKNSVCGEIVGMDVVCDKADEAAVGELIRKASSQAPDKFCTARIVNFVRRIETSASGKKKRI